MTTDELDGVLADPMHHRVLFENDRVRIVETTIAVGEVTPLHTHLLPTAQDVVSGSHFIRRDEQGRVLVDTRSTPGFVLPVAMFAEAVPRHTIENPGPEDLVVIGVELRDRPAG